jgi:hypothetical protein
MDTDKIRQLIQQGRLLTSPLRPRSPRDVATIRAALHPR